MINVQMFNILIKDSAAFKLNTSIKPDRRSWKVKLVLWSAWFQGLPSCLQRAGEGSVESVWYNG